MSDDQLFKAAATEDQLVEVEIAKVKSQFTKEDGSIDVDALAKSKAHSNVHISKVESEAANLRKEVDTRATYQDLLDKITAQQQATSNQNHDNGTGNEQTPKGVTADEIERMLETKRNQWQQEAAQASNVRTVAQELHKQWGPGWEAKLKEFAARKHQDERTLESMARTNPKGLLAILLPENAPDNTFVPPQTRQNTTVSAPTGDRTNKYYSELFKKDPKKRSDSDLIDQMHKDALRLGAAFFDN